MSKSRNLATLLGSDGSVKTTKYVDEKGGVADFVASGALPDGSTVILKDDGTVTKVGNITSALAIPYGTSSTAVAASNNNKFQDSAVSDVTGSPTKIVTVYRDGNSYGAIVVGTVSGTTITFGTPQIFSSMRTDYTLIKIDPADPTQVLIHYTETFWGQPNFLKAGTLSGNTISFGPAFAVNTIATSGGFQAFDFDQFNTGKFVLLHSRSSFSQSYVSVGTISNNVITLGTSVNLPISGGYEGYSNLIMDPHSSRFVVLGHRQGNGQVVVMNVGTISGTTITLGAETQAASDTLVTAHSRTVCFDPLQTNKLIYLFSSGSNAKHVVGTLSGTTVSFGAVTTHGNVAETNMTSIAGTASAGLIYNVYQSNTIRYVRTISISGTSATLGTPIDISFSSNPWATQQFLGNHKVVLSFSKNSNKLFFTGKQDENSGAGTAKRILIAMGQLPHTASNLTADNFIGMSSATYADGETATVTLAGSVSDNQTGLTTNSVYYVLEDGTLSTTADALNVEAGRAISSTSLLLTSEAGAAGADGSDGIQGIQGIQGAAGLGIQFLGQVATTGDLPTGSNTQGDAYIVQADDSLHVWDGTSTWVSGGSIQGPQGIQGSQGNVGAAGSDGVAGSAGTDGADGADAPGYTGVHMQESEPLPLTFDEVWLKPTTGEWSKSIPGTPSVSALSEANITILAGTLESAPALSAGQDVFSDLGYGTMGSYSFDYRHKFLSTLIVPSSVLSIRTTGNSKLYI